MARERRNHIDQWHEDFSDLRSKVLWCRSILDENIKVIDGNTSPISEVLPSHWRRYFGMLTPMEQRELTKDLRALSLQMENSLRNLEHIEKKLAEMEDTTLLLVQTLTRIQPHAEYVDHFFPYLD